MAIRRPECVMAHSGSSFPKFSFLSWHILHQKPTHPSMVDSVFHKLDTSRTGLRFEIRIRISNVFSMGQCNADPRVSSECVGVQGKIHMVRELGPAFFDFGLHLERLTNSFDPMLVAACFQKGGGQSEDSGEQAKTPSGHSARSTKSTAEKKREETIQ